MVKYHGASRAKLDDRGRLYLPSRWAERAGEGGELVLTAGPSRSLWLMERVDWEEAVSRLDESVLCSQKMRRLRALLVGYAEVVAPDKQSRIQISEPLRTLAGFENLARVFLVGTGRVIEIWDEKAWNQEMDQAAGDATLFDLRDPGSPHEDVRIPETTT